MKSFLNNTWKSTTSCLYSSWEWYSHLPLWQQTAIAGGTVLVVGGAFYLFMNGKGGGSPSSSAGESIVSNNTPNLDSLSSAQPQVGLDNRADSIVKLKAHISDILGQHISSEETLDQVSTYAAHQLVDYGTTNVSISMVEALIRKKAVASGISLENVFPGIFRSTESVRPEIISNYDLTTFGSNIFQKFFHVGANVDGSAVSSPQSWVYLENLCTKPLYFFLQNGSAETTLDVSRLKVVCQAVNTDLINPIHLSKVFGQDPLLHSWHVYYEYLIGIPLPLPGVA